MNAETGLRTAGKHDDLTRQIIGVFYEVYNELGYGFLESVYEGAMCVALREAGLTVETQTPVSVRFRGQIIGVFRADLVVNGRVLIELKAVDGLLRQHESQTLHYLKATEIEVALLMNFGTEPRFKRLVMDNAAKHATSRSVLSASIGVRPSVAAEVTR